MPRGGAGSGAERGGCGLGVSGWVCCRAGGRARLPLHTWHLPALWSVPRARRLCPAACGGGQKPLGTWSPWLRPLGGCSRGWGPWAGPAPLWAQGSCASLQEQLRGAHRGGLALCPPCLSQVSPAPCWQYCCAGEDTPAQFRHCRFLICLFIIQKLAHILMNP